MFLRRSRASYDWILLDAFDRAAQIPVHLTTREFFALLRERLAEGGVMLTNLHQGTRFFASEVLTIDDIFPDMVLLPVAGGSNVIVAAAAMPAGSIRHQLQTFERHIAAPYRRYGVDLVEIARRAVFREDYLPGLADHGVILTDDYAPVESLDWVAIPLIGPGRQ
jgi:hypothetical protein